MLLNITDFFLAYISLINCVLTSLKEEYLFSLLLRFRLQSVGCGEAKEKYIRGLQLKLNEPTANAHQPI